MGFTLLRIPSGPTNPFCRNPYQSSRKNIQYVIATTASWYVGITFSWAIFPNSPKKALPTPWPLYSGSTNRSSSFQEETRDQKAEPWISQWYYCAAANLRLTKQDVHTSPAFQSRWNNWKSTMPCLLACQVHHAIRRKPEAYARTESRRGSYATRPNRDEGWSTSICD